MSRSQPTIESHGWVLLSAEEQNRAHPKTFLIPSREERDSLTPGDGARLLFDMETREGGVVIDRGVDRMWVIVKARRPDGYVGVLDNDPGAAENLRLREGDTVVFGPQHVANIESPPREYVLEKYGPSFFEERE